jgi:Holliday junction resolvase RusA-like endonuclease
MTSFTVPGRPVAHALKKTISGGFPRIYLTPAAAAYQTVVAHIARLRCRPRIEGPVSLSVRAYATPDRGRMPDLTNITKLVEDAIKGIAFGDDRWTRHSEGWLEGVSKRADERVEIEVRPLGQRLPPSGLSVRIALPPDVPEELRARVAALIGELQTVGAKVEIEEAS